MEKKLLGGVLLVVGFLSALFGIVYINSVEYKARQFTGAFTGVQDNSGFWFIGLGLIGGVLGIGLMSMGGGKSTSSARVTVKRPETINETDKLAVDPIKKCPQCAETIKLEAKVCRYCSYHFSADEIALTQSLLAQQKTEKQEPEIVEELSPVEQTEKLKAKRRAQHQCEECGAWLGILEDLKKTTLCKKHRA